ncbi:MAG TPA: tetratricopeptide repeat protein [Candidatus Limnocylindrales bacterium]
MDDLFARYQAALRAGHQLAADGKYREALAQYEAAARVAGERALPQIGIGGMCLRLGRAKEALAAYERALAAEPDNLDALSGKAAALLASGRRADAAAVTARIAALRQAPAAPAGVPAEMRTPLSRAEELAIAGEEALDAGRREAAIDAWLAEARDHADARHFDAALDAQMRALALDTGSIRVHLELTRLYLERGWQAEAAQRIHALRRLVALVPDAETSTTLDGLEGQLHAMAVDS